MKCIRCNKALKAYAVQVTDSAGQVAGWGPKCGRLAFASKARPRSTTARPRMGSGAADARQIDWLEQVAA